MSPKYMRCIVGALLSLLCASTLNGQGKNSTKDVKRILASQGFTGVLSGRDVKIRLDRLGDFACANTTYTVFLYEAEQTDARRVAIHAIKRVIFISNSDEYIGSYVVGDRPRRMARTVILFDYPEAFGNAIACTATGLPKEIVLDGEQHSFGK